MSSYMQSKEEYIETVQRRAREGGVDGPSYEALADFLSHEDKSESRNQPFVPSNPPTHGFAWYRSLHPDGNFHRTTSPNDIIQLAGKDVDGKAKEGSCQGGMILFRGYPKPDWITSIGCQYRIDPAYWIRHLDFLKPPSKKNFRRHAVLPSSLRNIFRFHFNFIGQHTTTRRGRSDARLLKLRTAAEEKMREYARSLRDWHEWPLGDSIVRKYSVHDDEHYSVEHAVTVCFHPIGQSRAWLILIFIDYGEDLSNSRPGPWRSNSPPGDDFFDQIFNIEPPSSDLMLQSSIPLDDLDIGKDGSTDAGIPQRLSNLHQNYGRTLDNHIMAGDPFYALHEIFRLVAAQEAGMLELVADKLRCYSSVDMNNTVVGVDRKTSPSGLLYYQDLLEHHNENIQTILGIIKRRGDSNWPKATGESEEVAANAACSLEQDFESLLKQGKDLLAKSERLMTMAMSIASISEAKRQSRQGAMLFRFTVVASFYIPLSFTTSFFGMNVRQLGQGSQSIWLFFVITVPVLLLSFLFIVIDRLMFRKFFKSIARFVKGMLRKDR